MKRVLSLVLVLILVAALFAGCSNTGKDDGNQSGYKYEPLFDPDIPADQLSDITYVFEDLPSAKTVKLPLAESTAEITAYFSFTSTYFNEMNDTPVAQEMERRTNVHVVYDSGASGSNANETFQLMIASDLLPDIIFGSDMYIGGGDKGITDGVYLKLNDLIAEHAPNYNAVRHISDEHMRGSVADSGNIYGFCDVLRIAEPPWCGLTVRKDWLDDLGMQSPVTLADWENMMDQFMDKKGAEYGVCINPAYIRGNNNDEFITTFDVNYGFYQINGKVQYGPTSDNFRDYLAFAHEWYEKGYIDNQFFRYTNYGEYVQGDAYTKYGEGKVGAAQTMVLATGKQLFRAGNTSDPNFYPICVRNPVRNAGDTMHFRQVTSPVKKSGGGQTASITTQAKDPVLCAKWLDYRYTWEGALLINWGVPGNGYVYDDNTSTLTFSKEFVEYEDGLQAALQKYIGANQQNAQASIYSTRGPVFDGAEYAENAAILAQDAYDYVISPDVEFLNAEEGAEYAAIYADIQTYLDEMTVKFINGTESLDNFPKFVEMINKMNIERCIQIKQNGLDSYNARPVD